MNLRQAWRLTAAVALPLGLAMLPAVLPHHGQQVFYDAPLAVNTLTLMAVGVYTYLTYRLLTITQTASEVERCRQQVTLATSLLVELVILEDKLRFLHGDSLSEYTSSIEYPILSQAIRHIDTFEPSTAYLLVRLHQHLARVARIASLHGKLWRASPSGMSVSLSNGDANKVVYGLELLSQVVAALRPIAPAFNRPWHVFNLDDSKRRSIPPSAFADIPEVDSSDSIQYNLAKKEE